MRFDLPFAQVSRSVKQNVHTTFSFPNPLSESRNYSLGDVRRLCYHPWCDSMVIVEQINNSSNVYLSSSRFRRPPLLSSTSSFLSRNREYHLKTLDLFTAISHKPFAPILVFLSQIDRFWNKILWQLSVYFRHPWCIKETDSARQVLTHKPSKKNNRNSVRERMLVDST
jgi:hypothetical protein